RRSPCSSAPAQSLPRVPGARSWRAGLHRTSSDRSRGWPTRSSGTLGPPFAAGPRGRLDRFAKSVEGRCPHGSQNFFLVLEIAVCRSGAAVELGGDLAHGDALNALARE